MSPARLEYRHRHRGAVSVNVFIQQVDGAVVRLLSGRPLPEGSHAVLMPGQPGAVPVPARVSRCHRLITGLYELSLAVQPGAPGDQRAA